MEKEDALVQILTQISDRLSGIERRQENDKKEMIDKISRLEVNISDNKKEMITSISDNKKETLDKITHLEVNNNQEFQNITDSLGYERKRLDEIHKKGEKAKLKWSAKIMALNTILAAFVAFLVSSFK